MATTTAGERRATFAQADRLRQRCRAALSEHRRRAKADGAALDYGVKQLEDLARHATACAYCRAPLSFGFELDHRTPTARGGPHALGDLAACCHECNSAKGLLTAEEFVQLRALLGGWHPRAGSDVLGRLRSGGKRYRGPGRRGWPT